MPLAVTMLRTSRTFTPSIRRRCTTQSRSMWASSLRAAEGTSVADIGLVGHRHELDLEHEPGVARNAVLGGTGGSIAERRRDGHAPQTARAHALGALLEARHRGVRA